MTNGQTFSFSGATRMGVNARKSNGGGFGNRTH